MMIWNKIYTCAIKEGHTEEHSQKLANTIVKCKARADEIKLSKIQKRVVFLKEVPPVPTLKSTKCQARTLENKPCPFRATCGCFCQRHKV